MIRIHGEIHSSKNSRQIHKNQRTGATFVAKSKASKADEGMLLDQLLNRDNLDIWNKMARGSYYPIVVCFRFHRKTRAKWDFANLVQGVADAMVKVGYITDDDVDHFIPEYAGHDLDKKDPGVEFWIKDIDED